MDIAPILLNFINKRFQENIQVADGFHPKIMALEPQIRALRESAVTLGRPPAETLLKVGQGRLQDRIVDRRLCSVLV